MSIHEVSFYSALSETGEEYGPNNPRYLKVRNDRTVNSNLFTVYDVKLGKHMMIRGSVPDSSHTHNIIEEARILAGFSHVNIIKVFDCIKGSDGEDYYLTEFLKGENLHDRIDKIANGELPCFEIDGLRKLVFQVGSAVVYIHSKGYVLADLIPGNIMIHDSENAVLIDLGALVSLQYGISEPIGLEPFAPVDQVLCTFSRKTETFSFSVCMLALLGNFTNDKLLQRYLYARSNPGIQIDNPDEIVIDPKYQDILGTDSVIKVKRVLLEGLRNYSNQGTRDDFETFWPKLCEALL